MKIKGLFLIFAIQIVSIVGVCAQVFDIVVAKDGTGKYSTIAAALNAVTNNKATRTLILVKKGVYNEKVTMASSKINVSLIGENVDSVIIVSGDYVGKAGISGYQLATTFIAQAPDFYAENITFKNIAGDVGQALAISTEGDKQVYKNCKFLGFQDTYRASKNRQYTYKCYIEGGTDFIYAGSQGLFEKCTLNCVSGGSYITAPEDAKSFRTIGGITYSLGLLFSECKITANSNVSAGSYYLGRPWGAPSATSVFVNCELGTHIASAGWTTMTTDAEKTAFFAEYGSVKPDASLVNVAGRVSWSKQLTDNQYNVCYNPDSFLYKNGVLWNPRPMTVALSTPAQLTAVANVLNWPVVDQAKGYLIYRNGNAIGFSTTANYTDTMPGKLTQNSYTIRSVSANGNLSIASVIATGLWTGINKKKVDGFEIIVLNNVAQTNQLVDFEVYSTSGILIKILSNSTKIDFGDLKSGVFIVKAKNRSGVEAVKKLLITND